MKIDYDSDIWNQFSGIRYRKQKVNWRFEYAGMQCVIPAVYLSPKGIFFDIFSFVDEKRLRKFYDRYRSVEDDLTPSETRCALQEHPFQPIPIEEIWLSGVKSENGISYSHAVSYPYMQQEEWSEPLRRAFPSLLNGERPFACQRVRLDYPGKNPGKLLRRLRLNRIKGIRIDTAAFPWFYPLDISFELPAGNADKQVDLTDPATGTAHRLYFSDTVIKQFPFGQPHGLYTMLARYEIDPALPERSSISFKSSISFDQPIQEELLKTADISADECSLKTPGSLRSAAAIGIIGGADGPTSIFVSGKEKRRLYGPHGLQLHDCFSIPAFAEKDAGFFTIEGITAKHIDKKTFILGAEAQEVKHSQ